MKLFKGVTFLSCIYCDREFPLDDKDFRTMNSRGWGCCGDCWTDDYPNKTAANSVYIPPEVLATLHNQKHATEKPLEKK